MAAIATNIGRTATVVPFARPAIGEAEIREALAATLASRGIATSIHFRGLHFHSYDADRVGLRRGRFPNAEFVSDRTLSLPLSPALRDAEVRLVRDAGARRPRQEGALSPWPDRR